MKVKCVDNWFYEHLLGRNKIYKVIRETNDSYVIMVDRVGYVSVSKDKFIIYKEDKMEAKVVRKLEDLDGLENGMGAELIYVVVGGLVKVVTSEDELTINSSDEYSDTKSFLDTLKTMGFKFEYKPLRTGQEVLEEVEKEAKPFSKTHFCVIGLEKGKYIDKGIENDTLPKRKFLTAYMAKALADELNEIIGVGK